MTTDDFTRRSMAGAAWLKIHETHGSPWVEHGPEEAYQYLCDRRTDDPMPPGAAAEFLESFGHTFVCPCGARLTVDGDIYTGLSTVRGCATLQAARLNEDGFITFGPHAAQEIADAMAKWEIEKARRLKALELFERDPVAYEASLDPAGRERFRRNQEVIERFIARGRQSEDAR